MSTEQIMTDEVVDAAMREAQKHPPFSLSASGMRAVLEAAFAAREPLAYVRLEERDELIETLKPLCKRVDGIANHTDQVRARALLEKLGVKP